MTTLKLKDVLAKAEGYIAEHNASGPETSLRLELEKLEKDQLIEELVKLKLGKKKKSLNGLIYAILSDPDCTWLTWDVLEQLIREGVPGTKTTANSLRWYQSEGIKLGMDIKLRKTAKEVTQFLIAGLTD